METLGQRIKRLRREKGITQSDLAKGLITGSMVSQIESDKATGSEEVMRALSERLGVAFEELVSTVAVRTDQAQVYRQATERMQEELWDEAIRLLSTLLPPNPPYRPMVVLQDLMDCYENAKQYDDLAQTITEYIALCYQQNDVRTVLHAYFRLARVERQRNRYEMARKYLLSAVDIHYRYPELDMPLIGKIYTYLGRTCLAMHLPGEALAAYQEALRVSDDISVNAAALHHGIASVYLDKGVAERARPHIEQAIQLYEENHDFRLADLCRLNLAVIDRKTGRHPEAMTYLESLSHSMRFANDSQIRAGCCVEQALNAFALGQYHNGIAFGQTALQLHIDPKMRTNLYLGLLDATERLGMTDLFDTLFEEALDVSHQIKDEAFRLNLHVLRLKCLADRQQMDQAAMVAKHFVSEYVDDTDQSFPRE